MRKFLVFLGLMSFVLFQSCSKGGGGNNPPTDQITVSTSKSTISADGFEEVTISVKDAGNNDVTGSSAIYVNGVFQNSNIFYTTVSGTYAISAKKAGVESAPLNFVVTNPGPSVFTQKVLIEDYTGTWCGHCPRVGIQLENYKTNHPNHIVVGVHNNDPMQYVYEAQMRSAYGITGFPTVMVDRGIKWNESNSQLDNAATRRAALGLALETTVNGSTINVKTKVKFDVNTAAPLNLVVMLVEDNLVYSQTNYGYFGLPDQITNYVHNGVLRKAATDIFGDLIPTAQQVKGTTWERDLSFNATGYTLAKCKIVAFVVFGPNTQGRKGIVNAQAVTAGQNKAFD